MVTETVNEVVTIDPEPVEFTPDRNFSISYASTSSHLASVWLILILFSIFFGLETIIVLRLRDVSR